MLKNLNLYLPQDQIDLMEREGIDPRAVALAAFDASINETTTDAAIDWGTRKLKLPFYLAWIPLRRILDALLPEQLRRLLVYLLYRNQD